MRERLGLQEPPKPEIDARTFQAQLATLANTLALKVQREAIKTVKPSFVAVEILRNAPAVSQHASIILLLECRRTLAEGRALDGV